MSRVIREFFYLVPSGRGESQTKLFCYHQVLLASVRATVSIKFVINSSEEAGIFCKFATTTLTQRRFDDGLT